MSEIRFNSIFDGVTLALHAAFPDAQIHGGEVEQGLRDGDFNVVLPGGTQAPVLGRRYRRGVTVDVIYYPRTEDRAECLDMAGRLSGLLEDVSTPEGGLIHSVDCQWTITGGVLHVLVEYDHFVCKPHEEIMMGELKINQRG